MNHFAEPARCQPSLSRSLINGYDSPHFQRGSKVSLRRIRSTVQALVEDLELRLHQLQFPGPRILLDLAVERNQLARFETIFEIGGVEPEATDLGPPLAGHQFKNRHPTSAEETRVADLRNHGRHFARLQLFHTSWVQPVFVAKGKVVQQVMDGMNSFGTKHIRQPGTYPLHVLYRCVEIQHDKHDVSSRQGKFFRRPPGG